MARYYYCVACKQSLHDESFGIHGEPEGVGLGVCDTCVEVVLDEAVEAYRKHRECPDCEDGVITTVSGSKKYMRDCKTCEGTGILIDRCSG